jgi:predicted dehydrogenase
MHPNDTGSTNFNRRDFIKGSSFATLMTLLGGVEIVNQSARAVDVDKLVAFQVKCAVIGLGPWGREILTALSRQKEAEIVAVCDKYGPLLKRGAGLAPKAEAVEDYKKVLENKDVRGVFIATPTHQHKQIVIDALQAGKHVYCEAPIASTIEDARAIALAAQAAKKVVFQAGMQMRSDPQRHFLLTFIRSGAIGKTIKGRSQWHRKQSWRFPSSSAEREKEINWRVRQATSSGLAGELGVHQIDFASWYLNGLPTAVTGFGGVMQWDDGRDVPDTVQAVFEYPDGVKFSYECTLANSFDSDYEMLFGTEAAVMLRGTKAWLFKEADAQMLGWEIYARKDVFYKETGIALVANATKSSPAEGEKAAPTEDPPYANGVLNNAIESFLYNVNEVGTAGEDLEGAFKNPNDVVARAKVLAALKLQPYAGYKEAYEAAVVAIKANEAIVKGGKVKFEKEWFDLA